MRWIILSMVLFIGAYTYLNLHYRKLGPSYRPYQDAREKLSIAREGYSRITITAVRPTESRPATGSAAAATQAGGLPDDLRRSLLEFPLLPAEIGAVCAADSIESRQPYPVTFACTLTDPQQQLGGARLYIKGSEVLIVANFERLTNGLVARRRQDLIALTVPAGSLEPGQYRMTLIGQLASKRWTLQVH